MHYPIKARIVDVTDDIDSAAAQYYAAIGWKIKTPEVSIPFIGKVGLAERVDGNVRITFDDGSVLWGYECWWEPIHEVAHQRDPLRDD